MASLTEPQEGKKVRTNLPPKHDRIVARDIQEKKEFLEYAKAGEHYRDICAKMDLPLNTGYRWLKGYINSGVIEHHMHPYVGSNGSKMSVKVTHEKKDKFEAYIRAGRNITWASEKLEITRQTGQRWHKQLMLNGLIPERGSTDPIKWDDLLPKAQEALQDFGVFRTEVLGRKNNPPWAKMTADKLLELYRSDDDEYVVLNLAPGLGKSTLLTHDFVIWVVALERAQGKEPTILLGHKAWQKSTWYVKRCRSTFSNNTKLIKWYGRFQPASKLAAWSTEELLVEPLDWAGMSEKEPTIAAGAYDASILSSRHSIVIWDDLIDRGNSTTPEQREKMIGWWQQEAETRLNQGGLLVLSNARYGPEDLSWFVRQQTDPDDLDDDGQERPLYHRIAFPVHDESKCGTGEDGKPTHSGPWPDGCLLDPTRAGWKRVHRAKIQDEGRFELVWQQEDTDPVGFLAQRVFFEGGTDSLGAILPGCFDHDLRFGERPKDRRDVLPALSCVTVDPGHAKFWAIQHFLAWPDKVHSLYRGYRRVMKAPELLNQDFLDAGRYTGLLEEMWQASYAEGVAFRYLVLEENDAQRWLNQYPFFQRWCLERNVAVIPHQTNRYNRPDPVRGVEMTGPIYRWGKLRIPYAGFEERTLADQFRKEACSWPEGQTSDLVMGHWFFASRLELLLVGAEQDDLDVPQDRAPAFVYAMQMPRWAQKRLKTLGAVS